MNRKNLTAAMLAALAGVAGIAGTAQAVNVNPDGTGQVLLYPYYTTNDGNQTILSVVNTTDKAKAVKVRFLEGYNSREVLDFNLYLSHHDVWVAAIGDLALPSTSGEATPGIVIPDNSCTVPYLYGMGVDAGMEVGMQEFLPYAYTGDYEDGGPTDTARQSEGYFQMIEMGTLTNASERDPGTLDNSSWYTKDPGRLGSADAATHIVMDDGSSQPADCEQLVRNWTDYDAGTRDDPQDGMWFDQAQNNGFCDPLDDDDIDIRDCKAWEDTERNSGGLFGSAAVINSGNGTMFSYDPKAIQGYDKSDHGLHYVPGTIHPSLNDGNQRVAYVFFGTPTNEAIPLVYPDTRTVEAISATLMHDNVMNEYVVLESLDAATEWVFNFPTKNWYVDQEIIGISVVYVPNPEDPGCNGWDPGEPFPPWDGVGDKPPGWEQCEYVKTTKDNDPIPPFTSAFDGEACEVVSYEPWDRDENADYTPPGTRPPIVSPAPPGGSRPDSDDFVLCYEVNVMRFDDEEVFGTESDLLVEAVAPAGAGWANVNFSYISDFKDGLGKIERHQDRNGLVGLPVIGFAAEEYENGFLDGGSVLANYGGLFDHKSSVRRIDPEWCYHNTCTASPQ